MNYNFSDKIFYHIYALGMGGCDKRNNFSCPAGNFFEGLENELDRIKSLGCNAILIGPVFESTAHGYDTVDYYHIDRRLGNNEKFKHFSQVCHEKGFSVCLDAVFNHTGRDFFAFKDIQQNGENSQYKDWYLNLNFSRRSNLGDCFDYDGWAGCKDLVKLNVENTDVQNHLFGAVKFWIEAFGIDGLRLDAADVLSKKFLDNLGAFCRGIKSDFWLMGEVVHGDYSQWAMEGRIDSVTNYQIYKALWSSLNEQNFYELSYNLNREFGENDGIYRYSPLYTFVDNHDVDRIGSTLKNPQKHLYLLYALEFMIPGIPSIYYGSEWGIKGKRNSEGDYELRPCLPPFVSELPSFSVPDFDYAFLPDSIRFFSRLRKENIALQRGNYRQEYISNRQFAFWREYENQKILIIANSDFQKANVCLNVPSGEYEDLGSGKKIHSNDLKGYNLDAASIVVLRRK